jgi:PAS domain S-box-containing protein
MIERSDFPSHTTQREGAEEELLRQTAYLDELFELAPDAVVLTTLRNPRILRINREFTRMFGYTSEEAVGNCLRNLIMPDGLEPILPEDPDLLWGRKVEWEVIRRRKDGTRFHAHIAGKRIELSDDEDAAYLIFRDISARKQAEVLFAGEKRLLEVIAAGGPLTATLDALCRLAEDVDRSSLTSILLLDRNGKQLHHVAGPSLPPNYVAAINGAPVGLGIGPCAAAAHLGGQVISLDMAADDRWSSEMRALALAHGLHACWSTPIKSSQGRVLGTFAIYPKEPASPTPEQRSRIEQLTHLASIAIERAHSIDDLRRSEERYARAMDAAGDGHIEWIVAADEFYASPRFLEMCGFPVDTTFRNWTDFLARLPFHPEDRDRVIDAINATLVSTTDRLELEMCILRHGETRWHHLTGLCSRNAAGELLRWNAAITDVTDRKLADEALRESEQGYALAMEASGEGHWDWNIVNNEYHVSPRLLELCRLPPGTTFRDRDDFLAHLPFHPEDRPRWEEAIAAHFAGETARFDIELRMLPHGETLWIHMTGMLCRDVSGKPVRWAGSVADITERKRADEALRESQERYERAMLAAEAGFWDWDVAADKFYVSPKLLEMNDFPAGTRFAGRADFMARTPFRPDDRTKWESAVKELFASGGTRLTMQLRSIHGAETRWCVLSGMCVRDPAGKVQRWTGSATYITEQMRAEEALRLSEERYALAMEASEEGHFDWNVQTDEIFASERLKQVLDLPADAEHRTRGDLMAALIPFHPDDRERIKEMTREALTGAVLHREFEYRLLRGQVRELRWIRSRWKIFRDTQGVAQRVIGVVRDITERKRVEQELRSRQEMLEVAQKAARAVAFEWGVDAGNRKNRWSSDLEAMYGIPSGSYDGTYESWKKLIHPEDWPLVRAAIKAAQQTGDVDAEYRVVHSGGAIRWLQAKGRMFFDPEGKPTHIVGFMLDVTDRHLAEEELQRMERQLRQAQRLEALGTLAGGIAHDFNNLLGAILGYGEMALRNVRAGSRLRRDIENIMIAGERGHALVERILAFSRSGVGEQVAVHVEEVVRETLALFAAKLPRHIVIERRLNSSSAAVLGDPTQIHQVLMNLLINAVQAMPSGGTLRVSLDRIQLKAPRVVTTGSIAAREYVVIDVSDSGSGIPAEILEKIFDPFFSTKEVGVGTGLGLSLVHGIVIGLGGAIDVATTVRKGSVFKVYLPLAGDVVAPSKPRKRLERKTTRTRRGRVMVIDDEEALVRLATETLTELGHSTVGFTSSAKAIAAFLADPEQFDAIITDESMPGASGSELIRKVRVLRPTIPILLVSGYLSAAVIERAREAGASEVLKKPLSARQLQVAVERVLSTGGPRTDNLASSKPSKHAASPRRGIGPSQPRAGPVRR